MRSEFIGIYHLGTVLGVVHGLKDGSKDGSKFGKSTFQKDYFFFTPVCHSVCFCLLTARIIQQVMIIRL